jgi:hypothetical protein
MVHFADLGLYLWIISSVILIYGSFFLIKSLLKIDDKFKPALLFFLFAFLVHLTEAFIGWLFLTITLPVENLWWLINPFLSVLMAILLLMSIKKFSGALEES